MPHRSFAPAKVNLGLSVLGRRADGYHDLHTLMVPLNVGDELEITPADTLTLEVQGADLPTDERNLVHRAAQAYLQAAQVKGGACIVLHKRLPLASGLGGGSSDAATTLLTLARLYPSGLDLHPLARSLGADVPFFLLGTPALAEGIGEILAPFPVPRTHLVLVNPGVEVSARDAYTWLAAEGQYTPPLPLDAIQVSLHAGHEVPYFNTLQDVVAPRHPAIQQALRALHTSGLHSPLMSGSGSTCFALAHDDQHAQQTAQKLQAQHPDWWVTAAHTTEG